MKYSVAFHKNWILWKENKVQQNWPFAKLQTQKCLFLYAFIVCVSTYWQQLLLLRSISLFLVSKRLFPRAILLTIVLCPSQTFYRFHRRAENKANAEMPQSCSFSKGPLRPPPILIQSPQILKISKFTAQIKMFGKMDFVFLACKLYPSLNSVKG